MRDCDYCHGERTVTKNFCTACQTHFPITGRINYKSRPEADEIETDEAETELTF